MTRPRREITCRDVAAFLAAYLADELDPARRTRFEAHVAACPECAAYLRGYTATIRIARDAARATDDVPPALVRAILAARA